VYTGQTIDSLPHGFGEMLYLDKQTYVGFWAEGKRSGVGKMVYANGDVKEGDWVAD
jgi:hypothetical protein